MKTRVKKRNYTALNLISPYSDLTKSGFRSTKKATEYIYENRFFGERGDWLIIDTKTLHNHLNDLDEELGYTKGEDI
jgi:hypothetical protein